jgi:seryl-tRNA synthetase
MLDINLLREDISFVEKELKNKKFDLNSNFFIQLEEKRKLLQVELENLQAKRNSLSKEIGILKSKKEDTTNLFNDVANIGAKIKEIELKLNEVQIEIDNILHLIPNLPNSTVPVGHDENMNQEIRRVGVPKKFDFEIKDHVDLGYNLDKQIDFDLSSKLSGSRFYVLKNKIAKLHRALANFMLDCHTKNGYSEIYVPYLVNSKMMFNTGQLPKMADDLFKTAKSVDDELYLIPTSEVPLTNLVANTILKEQDLPLKLVAHTPCFRSEAGSYGRDTRGMIRVHQFDKVEIVQIVKPDNSFDVLEELTKDAENILQQLELPYRVMLLCTGDMSFASAKTYDLEVWIPSQNTYREISSCSCMTDFQARRMQARYKNSIGKNELVHTLNGSALAIGRTLVAILENYQNADGTISVPKVLHKYLDFTVI